MADEHLQTLVASHDADTPLESSRGAVMGVTEGLPASKPWFTSFRKLLVDSLRNGEQCTLDHPVACVLVAASTQGQVQVMNSLLAPGNQPAVLRDGLADHAMAKSYVVLHDCSASPPPNEQTALLEIRKAYGASSCQLIPMNSRASSTPMMEDVWTPARPTMIVPPAPMKSKEGVVAKLPPSPSSAAEEGPERRGTMLSAEDVERIQGYVRSTLVKQAVAHLQQRVMQLSTTVKASRQGLQNKLRSWLGGKKTGEGSTPLMGLHSGRKLPRYTSNTIEAQTVKLADYAFLLRDFATALTYYRAAGSEFKGDKAWRHYAFSQVLLTMALLTMALLTMALLTMALLDYAFSQEMAALCLYLTDGSRKEMEVSQAREQKKPERAQDSRPQIADQIADQIAEPQIAEPQIAERLPLMSYGGLLLWHGGFLLWYDRFL